jgi:DNA-binding NarL/FixJ family response regulator
MMMTVTGHERPQRANVILLANRPRMLRELMHQLLRRIPQTRFVFEFTDEDELSELLDAVHAQWLVISLEVDGSLPAGIEEIMLRHPDLEVLAMSENGEYLEIVTTQKEIQRNRIPLADISLNDLADVLSPK